MTIQQERPAPPAGPSDDTQAMLVNSATAGPASVELSPRVDPRGRLGRRCALLRVLFLVSAHNSLSQCAWVALTALGHRVTVAVVDSAAAMERAVGAHGPELIVCPMLKTVIPESIWAKHRCLIVHPGPVGDRGPSSLDWAIALGMRDWGVTVLQANAEVDAGGCRRRAASASRGGKEQPVSARGPACRHRGAGGGDRQGCRRRWRRSRSNRTTSCVAGRPAADDPGRPRDRLELGLHRHVSQDPRGRRPPRCSIRSTASEIPSLRRPPRASLPRPPRRADRAARRRDLPRDGRRRRLDHPSQASRHPQSGSSSCRPARAALTDFEGDVPESRSRSTHRSRRLHLPRDRLRGARGGRLPVL